MSDRRILFIVEGKKAEPRFLKKLISSFDVAEERNIYSFGTNIHSLYQKIFSGGDMEDIDFLMELKQYADEEGRTILSQKYTDIFLVFDAEVHDAKWDEKIIFQMMDYFDNSTEHGLLLLNYPMYESYRHMASPRDPGYLESTVSLEQVRGGYKDLVGREGCKELRDPNGLNKSLYVTILEMNVWKLSRLVIGRDSNPDYGVYAPDNLRNLLRIQTDMISEKGSIYILNTSVMVILEFIDRGLFI